MNRIGSRLKYPILLLVVIALLQGAPARAEQEQAVMAGVQYLRGRARSQQVGESAMIALARTHNRHGDRCTYEVNDEPNLSRWSDDTFDLIQTSRTLQHIDPRYSTEYVREFVRLLAPGGYLSFDLPSASGNDAALADGSVPPSAMRARIDITPSGPVDAPPYQPP